MAPNSVLKLINQVIKSGGCEVDWYALPRPIRFEVDSKDLDYAVEHGYLTSLKHVIDVQSDFYTIIMSVTWKGLWFNYQNQIRE